MTEGENPYRGIWHAPFTNAQVDILNQYQAGGAFHPYTCPNDRATLIAIPEGLICVNCRYLQEWSHNHDRVP